MLYILRYYCNWWILQKVYLIFPRFFSILCTYFIILYIFFFLTVFVVYNIQNHTHNIPKLSTSGNF